MIVSDGCYRFNKLSSKFTEQRLIVFEDAAWTFILFIHAIFILTFNWESLRKVLLEIHANMLLNACEDIILAINIVKNKYMEQDVNEAWW